jgi:hypothetical protein
MKRGFPLAENKRIGFYYYPDDQHYTQSDLNLWLPEMQSMGASWLTLHCSPDRAIPEAFIRGLIDAQIEPIVHIPCKVGSISKETIEPVLTSYARWGVRYVVVHDRPNLKNSWKTSEWGRTGLVERYLDRLLPLLNVQQAAGLTPILPPLEPGGDYWDTAFLEAVLASLVRRGEDELLQKLALGIYAWTYGKSIDWGKGGSAQWPEARPYHTPPECEDQIGFRTFDWYAEISEKVFNRTLPMIVIAGGELPPDEAQGYGSDIHAEKNHAIARALSSSEVPAQVKNFAFYHLATYPGQKDNSAAWFTAVDRPRPVVPMIQRLLTAEPKQIPLQEEKPIQHYVLLPPRPSPQYTQNWDAIGPFVLAVQPAVGFSAREARLAETVTLFGDEGVIPKQVEEDLRSTGCNVRRFTGTASREFLTKDGPANQKGPNTEFVGDSNA